MKIAPEYLQVIVFFPKIKFLYLKKLSTLLSKIFLSSCVRLCAPAQKKNTRTQNHLNIGHNSFQTEILELQNLSSKEDKQSERVIIIYIRNLFSFFWTVINMVIIFPSIVVLITTTIPISHDHAGVSTMPIVIIATTAIKNPSIKKQAGVKLHAGSNKRFL